MSCCTEAAEKKPYRNLSSGNTQCSRTIITVICTHYPHALGHSSLLGVCCSHWLSEADIEILHIKNTGKTSQWGKIHFYHTVLREWEKGKVHGTEQVEEKGCEGFRWVAYGVSGVNKIRSIPRPELGCFGWRKETGKG